MAAPGKGSRKINVDGKVYLWRIRRYRPHQQLDYPEVTISIQQADKNGTLLLVKLLMERFIKNVNPIILILPKDIEGFIRMAVQSGWKSAEPGKPFIFDQKEAEQFVHRKMQEI